MNVVLIMCDQQQASSLPMYGNPLVRTPNLSKLATEGTVFENAYTSCPLCVPARVSTFTGQYPSAHGSLNNGMLMAPGRQHLLRCLKDAGYVTGLAGKNHCFRAEDLELFDYLRQAGHGGPLHDEEVTAEQKQAREFLQGNSKFSAAWGYATNPHRPKDLGTAWTTDRAIEFVRAQKDVPFFLWYSIPDPHIPFQTCEPYASMYKPEDVDLPPLPEGEMERKPRAHQIDWEVMRGDVVDEQTIRAVRAMYYGMNTYVDAEIGRFLDELETLGIKDDTLLVYVSDHGEYLGEHRMIRKSKAAYDCLIHVPFIVAGPGVQAGRSEAFVSLEDIMPTVLSFLGIPCPAEVHGQSLVSLLQGGPFAQKEYAYGEYGAHTEPVPAEQSFQACRTPHSPDFSPSKKLGGYGKLRYLRTNEWKLVTYVNDRCELYHLPTDPYELDNIYGSPQTQPVILELQRKLLEAMMRAANPGVNPPEVS